MYLGQGLTVRFRVHFVWAIVYVTGMTVAAVIVAGGSGIRAGGEKPKQYQLVGGAPVIRQTIEAFLSHPMIDVVQVVIGTGHEAMYRDATAGLNLREPVTGGSSRQESCRLGLESLAPLKPSKVMIHDAARPFVSHDVITSVIGGLTMADAVIPGLPVADTMKFAPGGIVQRTVDRTSLWSVQTPQGFDFIKILEAHRKAVRDDQNGLTDDAAVAEYAGLPVRLVNGDSRNRKLTSPSDLDVAKGEARLKAIMDRPDVRTAQGIDFHTFVAGSGVTLCGVHIPHSHALDGHSDADVAMHALTDAILGCIGEGDIGTHFPPSDPQWKGAASSIFLQKAMSLLKARDGVLSNIDITVLAEAPKIAAHVQKMKAVLAPLLSLSLDRIAIKATTTEKMGAIGRKEGIAAFAIATARLPVET
jgi:2-C-methyl-D-erythritol 4-phosphate cytidylyltransferase / 2-C-methyl-D-erythritol 2,4-cyclodiphosphate synthase